MDKRVMVAYTEVDKILNLMDFKFQKKIPKKLRELISANKLNDYDVVINPNIPFKEQKISRKAISILTVLNYKYWCDEESEKQKILEKCQKNEEIKQEKLRKQYNPDNLFLNKLLKQNVENNQINVENNQIIAYNKKENMLVKIINKIKKLLRIDINQKK